MGTENWWFFLIIIIVVVSQIFYAANCNESDRCRIAGKVAWLSFLFVAGQYRYVTFSLHSLTWPVSSNTQWPPLNCDWIVLSSLTDQLLWRHGALIWKRIFWSVVTGSVISHNPAISRLLSWPTLMVCYTYPCLLDFTNPACRWMWTLPSLIFPAPLSFSPPLAYIPPQSLPLPLHIGFPSFPDLLRPAFPHLPIVSHRPRHPSFSPPLPHFPRHSLIFPALTHFPRSLSSFPHSLIFLTPPSFSPPSIVFPALPYLPRHSLIFPALPHFPCPSFIFPALPHLPRPPSLWSLPHLPRPPSLWSSPPSLIILALTEFFRCFLIPPSLLLSIRSLFSFLFFPVPPYPSSRPLPPPSPRQVPPFSIPAFLLHPSLFHPIPLLPVSNSSPTPTPTHPPHPTAPPPRPARTHTQSQIPAQETESPTSYSKLTDSDSVM